MRPFHARLDEALDELRRGDRPRPARADILHVVDRAVDQLVIGIRQREAPQQVARGLARCQQLVCQRIVIREAAGMNSCFAGLLSPQGKYLYDFIVIKHKSGYFIDCEKSQSEEIFKQLNLYKIRSKVEILNLSNEFVVASFGFDKYLSIEGAKDILGFTFKYREDPIILDPRNKDLGARLIINLEKLYLSLKKLALKNDKIENYYHHSHKLGIVPKNLNKLKNKLFGIECNFEELNEKSYLAHEEIFKCIENKDPIGADRVLGEHIEYVFENIYDMND